MKNPLVLVLIGVIAIIGGVFYVTRTPDQAPPAGAAASNEVTETQYLYGGLTEGGPCYATTTTGVLTSSVLSRNSCITIGATGAGQAAVSLTLQATTTMGSLVPRAGMCRTWVIDANAVAAATTTTIIAGTGVDLVGLDATGAGTGADVIDGDEFGLLKLCRASTGDVTGFVEEWIHAD